MKPFFSNALLAALLAVGTANAATTTPVGYTTTSLYGAFSSGSAKNNVVAPDLQKTSAWAGTIASISGDTLTLSGAAFTAGQFASTASYSFGTSYSYYIQTADGYWSHVVTNSTGGVTLPAGYGVKFTAGESVTIRPHVTISDYFGATNSAGLRADSTGDTSVADNVVLIDEVNGGTITVIASDALGGTWITDAFDDASSLPIYPDQGLQVLRRGAGNLSLVFSGEVAASARQIQIKTGVQIRPFVVPVSTTLTALGLYTGNNATGVVPTTSGDAAEADLVTVLTDGVAYNYFYSSVDLTGDGPGWYDDSLNFAGNVSLPAGAGLIINRNNPTNSAAFIWTKPALTL